MGSQANLSALISFDVRGIQMVAKANAAVSGLARSTGGLTTSFTESAVAARTFDAMTHKIGAWIPKLTSEFGQLELALQRAKGVLGTTERGLEAVNRIKNVAMDMRDVEHGPVALATAMLELNRAGIEGVAALREHRTVVNLATVAEYSMEKSAVAVANVMQAWGGPMSTGADLLGKFQSAANASTFGLGSLIQAMQYAQGPAQNFGQTLEQTLSAVTLLTPFTGATTKAGTAYAAFVGALADKKKQGDLKKMGIDILDAGSGSLRNVIDIAADLVDKTAGMAEDKSVALTKRLFARRGQEFVAAIRKRMQEGYVDDDGTFYKGRAALDQWQKKIVEGKTSLADAAKLARDSLPMAWQAFQSNIQRTLIAIGAKLAELFRKIEPTLTRIAGGLEFMFKGPLGDALAFGGSLLAIVGTIKLIAFTWRSLGLSQIFRGGGVGGAGGMIGGSASASLLGGAGATASMVGPNSAWQPRGAVGSALRSGYSGGMTGAYSYALTRPGIGSGLGALAGGAAGALAAMIGPVGLLTAAFYGLSEISDHMRRKEEARRQLYDKYKGSIGDFDLIARGMADMAKHGPSKSGNAQISEHLAGQFKDNPELWDLLTHAQATAQQFDRLSPEARAKLLSSAGLPSATTGAQYGTMNAGQVLSDRLGRSGLMVGQQQELLSRLYGQTAGASKLLAGVDTSTIPALRGVAPGDPSTKGATFLDYDAEGKKTEHYKQNMSGYEVQALQSDFAAQVSGYHAKVAELVQWHGRVLEEARQAATGAGGMVDAVNALEKSLSELNTRIAIGGVAGPSVPGSSPLDLLSGIFGGKK